MVMLSLPLLNSARKCYNGYMNNEKSCKVENCKRVGNIVNGKRYLTKGYCKSHYRRYLLNRLDEVFMGDPLPAVIEGNIAKIPPGVGGRLGFAIVDKEYAYLADEYHFHLDGNGYAVTKANGERILLHHLVSGKPVEGMYSDHINHDRLDNSKANLRTVTMAENNRNLSPHKNSRTSKYKGVFKSNGTWFASIYKEGKTHRSRHKTELEAVSKYNKLANELFGEYAFINETK